MIAGSLDANVVLRIILNDIPAQRRATFALFDSLAGRKLVVRETAIVEVVFVLGRNYKMSREDIATVVGAFLNDNNLEGNKRMLQRALPLFASHPALSFEDCCLAVYAELDDAQPLYTFDKKLAAQLPQVELVC